jgi:hypothetical protein
MPLRGLAEGIEGRMHVYNVIPTSRRDANIMTHFQAAGREIRLPDSSPLAVLIRLTGRPTCTPRNVRERRSASESHGGFFSASSFSRSLLPARQRRQRSPFLLPLLPQLVRWSHHKVFLHVPQHELSENTHGLPQTRCGISAILCRLFSGNISSKRAEESQAGQQLRCHI